MATHIKPLHQTQGETRFNYVMKSNLATLLFDILLAPTSYTFESEFLHFMEHDIESTVQLIG